MQTETKRTAAVVERFRRAQQARKAAGVHDVAAARELEDARRDLDAAAAEIAKAAPYDVAPVRPLHGYAGAQLHFRVEADVHRGPWRRRRGETVCAAVEAGAAAKVGDAVPCTMCLAMMERHAAHQAAAGAAAAAQLREA